MKDEVAQCVYHGQNIWMYRENQNLCFYFGKYILKWYYSGSFWQEAILGALRKGQK